MNGAQIIHGDCIEVMRGMPDNSIDAIVTDPPYGLGFMGKAWDALPPGKEWAEECLRVLKPGGHLLAFGGTRTWHRLAVAIEDAGFEMRDSIAWLYGSGFPKSLDVGLAVSKLIASTPSDDEDCECSESYRKRGEHTPGCPTDDGERAPQREGWGTALKPAFEPIVVSRKPLIGTVAANVLAHGTGAVNIDASRIRASDVPSGSGGSRKKRLDGDDRTDAGAGMFTAGDGAGYSAHRAGRFPSNVILDEAQAETFDEARFFYCAKASKAERPVVNGVAHETVKPLSLMRYLVKLVTPQGGVVLDPFAGSGTTLEACMMEGFDSIGVEREERYLPLIENRVARAGGSKEAPQVEVAQLDLFGEVA